MPSTSGTQRIKTERLVDHLVIEGLGALPDLAKARGYLDHLLVLGGDRAVFGACVLTLELALLKDLQALEDLPHHVGVLLEAFYNPQLANILIAGVPQLEARWMRIKPVVADFVALKQASAAQERPPPPDPERERQPTVRLPDLGDALARQETELEVDSPARRPTEQIVDGPRGMPRLATPTELIEEIQEILFEEEPAQPPAPPPEAVAPTGQKWTRTSEPRLADDDDVPLAPETRAFWAYAEKALGRVPDPEQSVVGAQSFAASRGSDRTHLVRFAHDLLARFPSDRHARALAALTLLYVAGQEKERGLLGVNRERLKLISTGLSLIGEIKAASQVAVLFESDGAQTRQSFSAVVDIVAGFLAVCAREKLDPRQPEAAARFTRH